jgi:hypothetical protein
VPKPILLPSVRVSLVLALAVAPAFPARSNTVPASPASSAPGAALGAAQLQSLVPEKVGAWKRHSLAGPVPGGEPEAGVFAQAEFRRKRDRATLRVASLGPGAPAPVAAAPTMQTTVDGSERSYTEGGHAFRETLRSADGLAELSVRRSDGLLVTVRANGVPPADLKALALAVKPAR